MLFLNILPLLRLLELGHLGAGFDLRHHQWMGDQADQDGEKDDRNPEISADQFIDQKQYGRKWVDNNGFPHRLIPYFAVNDHFMAPV